MASALLTSCLALADIWVGLIPNLAGNTGPANNALCHIGLTAEKQPQTPPKSPSRKIMLVQHSPGWIAMNAVSWAEVAQLLYRRLLENHLPGLCISLRIGCQMASWSPIRRSTLNACRIPTEAPPRLPTINGDVLSDGLTKTGLELNCLRAVGSNCIATPAHYLLDN